MSRHPADKGTTGGLPVTSKPFRFEASRGGALISRFSTVPFEAMARGMEFIYFNPHGERVPTFAEPAGAFASAVGIDELGDALRRGIGFFRHPVVFDHPVDDPFGAGVIGPQHPSFD